MTGPALLTLVPRAAAARADRDDLVNAPLDDPTAEQLIERAQRSNGLDRCRVCGIPQDVHWKCANCTCRGHHIPRSKELPRYCQWCVEEGSARRHRERTAIEQAA